MEEVAIFDSPSPVMRDTDYSKKIFTEDIIFMPDYIFNAINQSGVTVEQYIEALKSLKASNDYDGMWGLFYGDNKSPLAQTVIEYNQKIYKTIGLEVRNLLMIHKYIMKMLNISTYGRDGADVEYMMMQGLRIKSTKDTYDDFTPINLLKSMRRDVDFNDTYKIVNSDICLVILREGFANLIENYEYKKKLLDDILDSRQLFMGPAVFNSNYMKSSIRLNLTK